MQNFKTVQAPFYLGMNPQSSGPLFPHLIPHFWTFKPLQSVSKRFWCKRLPFCHSSPLYCNRRVTAGTCTGLGGKDTWQMGIWAAPPRQGRGNCSWGRVIATILFCPVEPNQRI